MAASSDRRNFIQAVGGAVAGAAVMSVPVPVSAAAAPAASADQREFLFSDGLTYLNTGTIGPCRRETVEETLRYWKELESLPTKFYGKFGAEPLAERTRSIAARFLGCDPGEMLITNSTTSGMNAVAQGLRLNPGDRILTTSHEHGGGLLCWNYLVKYHGAEIDTVVLPPEATDAGAIIASFEKGIRKETRLISVSHVFSSTGLRMPIAEISALARSKGALCIVDGAQSAGAIRVNVKELGCHAYATSGHKWLMGPKGTGLLYLSKDAQAIIRPMAFEDSYDTYHDGNGVVNLAAILGLGKAIEHLEGIGIEKIEKHNLALRSRLIDKLRGQGRLRVPSPPAGPLASPMVAAVLPDEIDKRVFTRMLLDKHRLSIRPTHDQFGFNGIRLSLHIFNSDRDVDLAVRVLDDELNA